MAKSKSTAKEFNLKFDRTQVREQSIYILEKKLHELAEFYGFQTVYASILENHKAYANLTKSGLLDEKQLLICKNKNGDSFILRPAGSLAALRVYATHQMHGLTHPVKIMNQGESLTVVRGKENGGIVLRPEWNLMVFGEIGPVAEAQIFQVTWRALQEAGLISSQAEVRINAWGCNNCKGVYRSTLVAYLRSRLSRLCKNCKNDLRIEPTKIFACQEEKCKIVANNAPPVLDFLCDLCKKYLKELLEFLDELELPYILDSKFFKSDSWYNNIVWEMYGVTTIPRKEGETEVPIGTKVIFGEGGCMSKMAEVMVGRPTEVFAGTIYVEALESFMFQEGMPFITPVKPKLFLTQLGDLAKRKSFGLLEELRKAGIIVSESLGRDAIKSQLKTAENVGAETALILGQKEALDKTIIVRDLQSGMQETIPQSKLVDFINKKLKR